ncbi:hypothetical protein JAAARDRAFT_435587 [Jaapia argillacea MUCL 33604]|uniref:Homeobox domain-containing protein n=1 Tax=Jaapia argillacea MUCL 33604 TaxID=933084 RepID=A0A067PS12_9AGAM|nr:hypothetical protein JAAARDRAFT_435587 [Jaapia argillacea MUCL 33604]
MESRVEGYRVIQPRARPPTLHIDPAHPQIKREDGSSSGSSASSPDSESGSPTSPVDLKSASSMREFQDFSSAREPQTGPQRSSEGASTLKSGEKEKRKRSRVTPEQLVHLERYFAADRIPTAAKRKEISDILGMNERQTQIWFQNRRAKAKLQDGRDRHRGFSVPYQSQPATPECGVDFDLRALLREDDHITMLSCTDLTVGSWRRVATAGRHDLLAYICNTKQCLTWFIHSSGHGFKMEVPFSSIVNAHFTNTAPGVGIASFFLSHPPIFYLENSDEVEGNLPSGWRRCADWTEGMQATSILRHELMGSAVQLSHLVGNFQTNVSEPEIRLHSPSYLVNPEPATPTLEDQEPPMTAMTPPSEGFRAAGMLGVPKPEYYMHHRKRSLSGPPALSSSSELPAMDPRIDASMGSSSAPFHTPSPYTRSSDSPSTSGHPTPLTPQYPLPTSFPDYTSTDGLDLMYPPSSGPEEYIHQQQSMQGSYFAQPMPSPFLSDDPNTPTSYDMHLGSVNPFSDSLYQSSAPTQSPILTTAFHPRSRTITPDGLLGHFSRMSTTGNQSASPALMSALGGVPYSGP